MGARRLVAAVLVGALVAAGCGDGSGDGGDGEVVIAFLRAVATGATPGGGTEPALLEVLRQSGFEEGRNLRLLAADPALAYPDPDDAARVVTGWVDDGVDVILAFSTTGAAVAAEAAPEVPVVFLSNDPAAAGLVDDESSPEGNLTGVTFRVPPDRTLDLARRLVPGVEAVGLAYPGEDPAALANRDVLDAASGTVGLRLDAVPFDDPAGLDAAVDDLARRGVGALVVSTSPAATRLLAETAAAAARNRLPVIANTHLATFAVASLSPDLRELGFQLGRQVARLLAGTDPSAIPVEDPRRFVLVVNAGAAAELGLTVPDDLIAEANEVVP